jgi:hypothetical protein
VLGIKHKASCKANKSTTTEIYPHPSYIFNSYSYLFELLLKYFFFWPKMFSPFPPKSNMKFSAVWQILSLLSQYISVLYLPSRFKFKVWFFLKRCMCVSRKHKCIPTRVPFTNKPTYNNTNVQADPEHTIKFWYSKTNFETASFWNCFLISHSIPNINQPWKFWVMFTCGLLHGNSSSSTKDSWGKYFPIINI